MPLPFKFPIKKNEDIKPRKSSNIWEEMSEQLSRIIGRFVAHAILQILHRLSNS